MVWLVWGWGVLMAKRTIYSYFISYSCCFVSYFISVHFKKQFSQNLRSRWFFVPASYVPSVAYGWRRGQVRTPSGRNLHMKHDVNGWMYSKVMHSSGIQVCVHGSQALRNILTVSKTRMLIVWLPASNWRGQIPRFCTQSCCGVRCCDKFLFCMCNF